MSADARALAPAHSRRRRLLYDDTIRWAQRKHFYLFDVLPALGFVASLPLLWQIGVTPLGVGIFVAMWVLNLIGIEVGYHRLFSHGAFQCRPAVVRALVVLGSMGAQGPVVSWASNHRHHHQFSDQPEDTHSPHHHGSGLRGRLRGFIHAHLTWKYDYPYPSPSHYTPKLLRDRAVIRTSRHYLWWIALGLAVPAAAGGLLDWSARGALEGFLLGGIARLFIGQQATWCINSVCHLWGTRPFASKDRSTNNAWLAIPTMGGSWHNTHHAFPNTANNSTAWWQLDLCYWVIRGLELCGLAWDVKRPSRAMIERKRVQR